MPQDRCINVFEQRMLLHKEDADVMASLNLALMPINLFANMIVMMTLNRTKTLVIRINKLFFLLAMSYFLSALLVQPFVSILLVDYHGEPSCLLEMITHYSYFLFSNVSSFIVIGLGIDQLVQHTNPFCYKYALTRNKALGIMVVTSLTILFLSLVYIVATCYGHHTLVSTSLSLVIVISSTILILGVMRVRAKGTQCNKHIYLQRNERNKHRFHQDSIAAVMLASTALSSTLFAFAEAHNAIKGILKTDEQFDISETLHFQVHERYWPSYVLYSAMIIQPLNGILYAAMFFYMNRVDLEYFVNKIRKNCFPSNEQKAVNV